MPIIHNESFHESDPFQLRRFGYNMEGGPDVVVEDGVPPGETIMPQFVRTPLGPAVLSSHVAKEPSLAHFLAYWTPERRARRVAEELGQ